ncbi:hypothetical protein [Chitinophaga lutea]|uniref:hypothetical protein n=1 Tax=Chitinophaga lutea TaxID=2488634 RepID=UPI000F5107F9|nr:hypothetical protein [Chitinophaga lutea]
MPEYSGSLFLWGCFARRQLPALQEAFSLCLFAGVSRQRLTFAYLPLYSGSLFYQDRIFTTASPCVAGSRLTLDYLPGKTMALRVFFNEAHSSQKSTATPFFHNNTVP